MSTEKIEGLILSEMKNSSKHSNVLAKKYLGPVNKLFESVFDVEKYQPQNTLESCFNNKLVFFKNVKNTIIEQTNNLGKNNIVVLNETMEMYKASDEFKISVEHFLLDLDKVINEISNENDFNTFDSYSRTVQKTLLFRRQPLNIMGFNIFEFLNPNNPIAKELLSKFGANIQSDLKLLIFNKSDKELYFFFEKSKTEKTIIFYNINTNNLDHFFNKDLFEEFGISNKDFNDIIWQNDKKYFDNFAKYINGNIIELYRNFSLYNIQFQDNLYKDIAWENYNQQIKKHSVIRK